MGAHTPGDWYAEDRGERIVILSPGYDYEIASLETNQSGACGAADTEADDNAEADAALIVSAPKMLAACERVATALDEEKHSDGQGYWSPSLSADDVRLIRAAIARARGVKT